MVFDICQGLWKSDWLLDRRFDVTSKIYFISIILQSKLKNTKGNGIMNLYLIKNHCTFKDKKM